VLSIVSQHLSQPTTTPPNLAKTNGITDSGSKRLSLKVCRQIWRDLADNQWSRLLNRPLAWNLRHQNPERRSSGHQHWKDWWYLMSFCLVADSQYNLQETGAVQLGV